jgi:diguanylate cyclase (GGDEF)-like protein/PAS domain S-box-containing protein
MEPLLSQDEIDALLSVASYETSGLKRACAAGKSGSAGGSCDPCYEEPLAMDKPGLKEHRFGIQSKAVPVAVSSSSPAFDSGEAEALAISLHQYLSPEGILRSCNQALRKHLSRGRVSLVQPRSNRTTATIRSLDDGENSPLIGPRVIELEPSRLKECMLKQQEFSIRAASLSQLDYIERGYLLGIVSNCGGISIVYRPLMLEDELICILVLSIPEAEDPDANLTSLISSMAPHISVALRNSEQYSIEQGRSRRLAMIMETAAQATAHEDDLEKCLSGICQAVRKSLDCRSVQIWVETRNHLNLMGHACTLAAEAAKIQQVPLLVQDCARQDQIVCNNNIRSEFGVEPNCEGTSQLSAPISLRGKCLGVLFLESGNLDSFEGDDIRAIEKVTSLIASRLQNSRTIKNSQRSRDYLQSILESMHDWAILSTDVHGYVFTCSVGSKRIFDLMQSEILGKDVLNLFTDSHIQADIIAYLGGDSASPCLQLFRVPQLNGTTTAYLDVTFQQVHNNEGCHIGFLCVVRDVTDKVSLERRLKRLTVTDDVTGLYNQRGFFALIEAEIKRCRKSGQNFSLCFLDLDGLKRFNDTYGHLRGSRVLDETARLLRESVRPQTDMCCRYGGDEFVIIMPQMSKIEARDPIEKIRAKLGEHFQGKITASFGITDFSDHSLKAMDLLARADRAMYTAKSQGKNRVFLSD